MPLGPCVFDCMTLAFFECCCWHNLEYSTACHATGPLSIRLHAAGVFATGGLCLPYAAAQMMCRYGVSYVSAARRSGDNYGIRTVDRRVEVEVQVEDCKTESGPTVGTACLWSDALHVFVMCLSASRDDGLDGNPPPSELKSPVGGLLRPC